MKLDFSRLLPFTILLISVSSVLPWCSLPIGNTTIWWCIQGLIIYCFFKLKPKGYHVWQIKCFLVLLVLSALYGAVFMAENYWDWKLLVGNFMVFFMPLAAYVYANPLILTRTLRLWFKWAWIILILLFPFLASDAFGRYLVPYSFMALFLPLLNRKYKVLVLLAYVVTITLGSDNRSDIIKFTVMIMLGLFCLIKGVDRFKRLLKAANIFLLFAPVVFFILGITGIFNIFKIEEELGLEGKYEVKFKDSGDEYSALIDTRTFLYVEELASALKHNYVLQGRSIARGYDSVSFGGGIDENLGIKRGERQKCETSILNIFNYLGLIGVFFYFLIFICASYKAIFKSRNQYIPIVGLAIVFRWSYAWIEDFSDFNLNMLMLFVMIGMCYSPLYRNMTNEDFRLYIRTFFRC